MPNQPRHDVGRASGGKADNDVDRPRRIVERQALRDTTGIEGIAKAKAAGVYKGRPASIDAARVRELKTEGMGPTEIAKTLKIGRASVYRVLQPTP